MLLFKFMNVPFAVNNIGSNPFVDADEQNLLDGSIEDKAVRTN